jgi:hypothetical protein
MKPGLLRGLVMLAGLLVVLGIAAALLVPKETAEQAQARKAAEQRRTEERAAEAERDKEAKVAAAKRALKAERAKREQCRSDLKCTYDALVNDVDVTLGCERQIERLARYSFRWTNSWAEGKFPRARWVNSGLSMELIGGFLELQNGFGAWQPHIYRCTVDATTHGIADVRAEPGRL